MPGYPWLYEEKEASKITKEDVVVPVPEAFKPNNDKKIVATEKLLDLIAYVQSLKQAPLPQNVFPEFIESSREKSEAATGSGDASFNLTDGKKLYTQNCAACHQESGEGLPGAFPALKGSPIVTDEDPDFMVRVILQGYDARSEFAQMPGFAAQLSAEEISAIINHERSSWGNKASTVTAEQVRKIREDVMKTANSQP